MKRIDMEMFRKIAKGRRREVPLRLYRWLDKQFYRKNTVRMDVVKLGNGTLGLSGRYPSELVRVLEKAAAVLIDCGFMEDVSFISGTGQPHVEVAFSKKRVKRKERRVRRSVQLLSEQHELRGDGQLSSTERWIADKIESDLYDAESRALGEQFGSKFERDQILEQRKRRNFGAEFRSSSAGIRATISRSGLSQRARTAPQWNACRMTRCSFGRRQSN